MTASPRYISAFGRDGDVAEGPLKYDAETRRLTVDWWRLPSHHESISVLDCNKLATRNILYFSAAT